MTQAWRPILESLSLRNAPVEITGMAGISGDMVAPSYRVRLLSFNDSGLIVERPGHPEAGKYIAQGARARILAVQGDHRWELWSSVTHFSTFTLNGATSVIAVHLTPPGDVRTGQRRSYYRVSTAGAQVGPIVLTQVPPQTPDNPVAPAVPDNGAAPAQDAPAPELPSFKARLINIGAGGIGIEAPRKAVPLFKSVKHFRCTLGLPGVEGPLDIVARVVHIEPLDGGTLYVGMAFEFSNQHEQRRTTALIQKFTTAIERLQLQRAGRRANER